MPMRSLRFPAVTATALACLLLAGCGARTSVTGEWAGTRDVTLPRAHLLVVGVTPNPRVRRGFELELARLVAATGARATAALQAGPATGPVTPETVATMVQASGADTVLVTRLVARRVGLSEAPGRVGVKTQVPANIKDDPGLVDLFRLDYNEYEEAGAVSARSTAVVETSVFEARDGGRLIYRITTTTEFDEERDDAVAEVTTAITRELRRSGLLR